jgi:hypothetical protein
METPLPVVLAWSAARPHMGRTTDWNTGCPVGYFAQFVPKDAPLATALPNGVEGVRCRLVTGDVSALAAESVSWEDTLGNVNAAILEAEAPAIPLWWLLGGLLGLWLLGRPART